MITFGIPSFNRDRYLEPLVESIYKCEIDEFEVLIVEDCSPEQEAIRNEVEKLIGKFSSEYKPIRYVENNLNLGFDKNLKKIISEASGSHIIFIGNDDIVNSGEMTKYVREILSNHDSSVFLRGYTTFDDVHGEVSFTQIVDKSRVANKYTDLNSVYRFSGIISGYAVNKKFADSMATDKFDGGLFYQLYLAFSAFTYSTVYLSSTVPVKCKRDVAPDFGSSQNEKNFVVGEYNLAARIEMVKTHLYIAEHFAPSHPPEFMKMYKRAMSANIAPHLITLQRCKYRNMAKMYLYLLKNGVGKNIRSLIIFIILVLFNKMRAAKILNYVSNMLHLSKT
ncbi:MAG: glycosyltransferase [Proteobacteria bacterium]|nr:glycosyltransferase [Pseudomonadota bacterium]MBU1299222.1 glycosyltransferase [Bacteroidota bacterium]MBU1569947.1 glycosyltransferase [Pseudomonadota bacterium]